MACLADSIMLAAGSENQAPKLKNDIQKVCDESLPFSVFTD
jgi:ribosomal protein S7